MKKKLRCPECATPLKPGETTCPVCQKVIGEGDVAEQTVDSRSGGSETNEETQMIQPDPHAGAPKPDKNAAKEQKAREKQAQKEQEAREKQARKEQEAREKQARKEQEAREKQAREEAKARAKAEKRKNKNPNTLPYILICILIAAIIGACVWFFVFYTDRARGGGGGGGGSHGGDDEKTAVADSTDSTGTAGHAGGAASVSPDRVTPDLAFNDLKGPVQFVRSGNDYGDGPYYYQEYFYGPDGSWYNIPTWNDGEAEHFPSFPDKYTKDTNGNIVSINTWTGNDGSTENINIVWENGRIKSKTESSYSNSPTYYDSINTNWDYTYDDKGLLVKAVKETNYSNDYGSGTNTVTYVYSYLKDNDDHGNWTRRSVNERTNDTNGTNYTSSYVEAREINYYK